MNCYHSFRNALMLPRAISRSGDYGRQNVNKDMTLHGRKSNALVERKCDSDPDVLKPLMINGDPLHILSVPCDSFAES